MLTQTVCWDDDDQQQIIRDRDGYIKNLEGKSVEELRQLVIALSGRLKSCCSDIADLRSLLVPLKNENVKLSRNLKWVHSTNQELTVALQKFLKDSIRGEWFKKNEEDTELCLFFRSAVTWYRLITKEDNSTLNFYRTVWMYEREDDEASGHLPTNQVGKSPNVGTYASTSEQSLKNDSLGIDQKSGFPEVLERTTKNLYDVCHERLKTMQMQEIKDRLESDNANLISANARLEKALQEALAREGSGARPVTEVCDADGGGPPDLSKSSKTLACLAANDAMWNRLLEDSELFSSEDIIDEAYEEFLHDVVVIMEENDCSFRKAIELLADREKGTISSEDAHADALVADCLGDIEPQTDFSMVGVMPDQPVDVPRANLHYMKVEDETIEYVDITDMPESR